MSPVIELTLDLDMAERLPGLLEEIKEKVRAAVREESAWLGRQYLDRIAEIADEIEAGFGMDKFDEEAGV
ncbi:MAG: hypothetical protein V3U45_08335 [bacterium]